MSDGIRNVEKFPRSANATFADEPGELPRLIVSSAAVRE